MAWVALVPLLVSLHGATGWRAARLGYVTGAVSAVGLLYWTAFVVFQYGGGIPRVVAVLITLALCVAFAVFPLVFGWATGRLVAAFGTRGLLGAPFLWVATELLRVHTFFEFPWCLLGYSQQPFLPVIQIASVTAVYGVSFLLVASSTLVAIALLAPRDRRSSLASLVALQALAWGGGAFLLSRPVHETGRITVGLVQGGIRQEDKWLPENAWSNVGRHLELTREAARRGARLVVWPESAVPFLYDEEPTLAEQLQEAVRRDSLYLYFGNDDRESRQHLRRRQAARPAGRRHRALPQDAPRALRRVRPAPGALHVRRPRRGEGRAGGGRLHPGPRSRHGRGRWPPHRRLHLLRGDLPGSASAASRPGARSCSSTSRTTPGTAPPRPPSSTSPWPPSAPSRTAATWCGRRTRASPPSSTPGDASRSPRRSSTARCWSARFPFVAETSLLHPPRRPLRPGLLRDCPRPAGRDLQAPSRFARSTLDRYRSERRRLRRGKD